MYILTETGLAESASLADAPKVSAADAQVLAKAATLAAACGKAVAELEKSVGFLATAAQQDLRILASCACSCRVAMAYGKQRPRAQDIGALPNKSSEIRLATFRSSFITTPGSLSASRRRRRNATTVRAGHRCWIYLCAANLTTSIGRSRTSSCTGDAHAGPPIPLHRAEVRKQSMTETPTGAAGALLDPARSTHCVPSWKTSRPSPRFNRQPHRRGSLAALPASVVKQWAGSWLKKCSHTYLRNGRLGRWHSTSQQDGCGH
jgi:hypothetical protein